MTVITVSREMGSGGDDIAAAVAGRLGLRLVGRELVNQAARQAGVPEMALAEIDELGLLGLKPKPDALRAYRDTVAQKVCEFAKAGDVLIVGRGGQAILADCVHALHVRIVAPLEMRIGFVSERCKIPAASARAVVDRSDRVRAAYLRHYGLSWDDPSLYDIVINMARLNAALAVETICHLAGALREQH